MALTVMNVAFDALRAEWPDTSTATLGWVLTGYNTMTAALLIAAGRVADVVGRKRTFLVGLVVFTGASVLGAVAPDPALVIASRVIQGAGAALVTPTSLALLVAAYPPTRRSTVLGVWGSVGALAAAGGPVLGGLLVDTVGWRWVFWLNVPVGLLVLAMAWRWLIDDAAPAFDPGSLRATIPDPLGIGLSALAVGGLALGLAQSGEWGWTDPRTLSALVAGPALGAVVVFRSARHANPVLELGLFRLRSFSVANAVMLLFSIGFSAMILNNVLFLSRVWGYSQAAAGLGIAPSPISAAVVAQLAGRAADRVGPRALIVPGITLFGAAMVYLAFGIGLQPDYWRRWFPAAICFGSGVGLTFTNLPSAAVSQTPPSRLALAGATNGTARAIGTVLGPALVVGLVGGATGVGAADRFDRVWLAAAAIAALAVAVALGLPRGSAADAVAHGAETDAPAEGRTG